MTTRPTNIIRHEHTRAFTVIANDILNDARLKLDEKALLCWYISLPPDWEVIPPHVCSKHKIGRDKYHRIMKSLRKAGYARLVVDRAEDGTIVCIRHVITDVPAIPDERVCEIEDAELEAADGPDEPAIPEVQDAQSVAPLQQPENPDMDPTESGFSDSGKPGRRISTKSLQNTPPTPQAVPADRPQAAVRDVPSFKLLAAKWPEASILSASTAERRYLRLTDERKRAAFDGVGAYLADMRQRGWKICDLQTYLRDRRWERVKGAPAPEVPILGNTPQASRWLDYRISMGQRNDYLHDCWRQGKAWYAPTEWPPPLPAAAASPPASPSRKTG
jgi:hypothetical protein